MLPSVLQPNETDHVPVLAEEVRRPSVTIPRAVVIALSAALVVYAAVALVLLRALGSAGTAASPGSLSSGEKGQRESQVAVTSILVTVTSYDTLSHIN